jgi:tyrosyl-tRNA synthetase
MEAGMSFTEFNYMLLQAYDFLVLHQRYGCELQMGGSDQWGNITSGIDLIRRVLGHRAYGLVTPLLQTSSGTKFGKTGSGTVWLDPKLTSPYRFYQFWVNTDDKDVLSYLKYFTLLDREEVEEISVSLKRSPEKREAQIKLATEVTKMVHGDESLKKAQHASSALFSREIQGLSKEDIIDIFADTPSTEIPSSRFIQEQIPVLDLVTECGFVSSKGEARRLIRSGGLYINNQKIIGEQSRVSLQESIGGTFFVLRRGARNFHLVRIVPQ